MRVKAPGVVVVELADADVVDSSCLRNERVEGKFLIRVRSIDILRRGLEEAASTPPLTTESEVLVEGCMWPVGIN